MECFSAGECVFSPVVEDWESSDSQECLELCRDQPGCRYFTQYDQDGICLGFAECLEFSEDTCQQCYSGSVTCPGALITKGGKTKRSNLHIWGTILPPRNLT